MIVFYPFYLFIILNFMSNLQVYGKVNNVCKTSLDYLTILFNDNCWYDRDVGASTTQMISNHNYKYEFHNLTTEDGYIISIIRIFPKFKPEFNQPILLVHGTTRDSKNFVSRGKKSHGFHYSDLGYDVWMLNMRGTTQARDHLTLPLNSQKYWDFSYHEWGVYDVKTAIDFVYERTKKKIIYIGHSVGTSASFVYASLFDKEAGEKMKGIVALAPIGNMSQIQVPTFKLLSNFQSTILFISKALSINYIPTSIIRICPYFPTIYFCRIFAAFGAGDTTTDYSPLLPVFTINAAEPLTIKNFVHLSQMMVDPGEFRQFNYGKKRNVELYGSELPPLYPVENIKIPVHFIHANYDKFAVKEDVEGFYKLIKSDKSIDLIPKVPNVRMNHLDFIIGANLKENLYDPIMKAIDRWNK